MNAFRYPFLLAIGLVLAGPIELARSQTQAEVRWMCSVGVGSYGPSPYQSILARILPTLNFSNSLPSIPVNGTISSGYGWRTHPISGRDDFHSGLDIAAPAGTPILSSVAGTVVSAGWGGNLGLHAIVESGTTRTIFGHMQSVSVSRGDVVAPGELLGLVGSTGRSTGPHLHFGVYQRGADRAWVSLNPSEFLSRPVTAVAASDCQSSFNL